MREELPFLFFENIDLVIQNIYFSIVLIDLLKDFFYLLNDTIDSIFF